MTKETITDLHGEKERVSLPEPHWSNYTTHQSYTEHMTGIWIEALYAGPRTGRKFAQVYSAWGDGRGYTTGDVYEELDQPTYLKYCALVNCDPVNVEAVEV